MYGFKCPMCADIFSEKSALECHQTLSGHLLKCGQCDFTCATHLGLTRHCRQKSHHAAVSPPINHTKPRQGRVKKPKCDQPKKTDIIYCRVHRPIQFHAPVDTSQDRAEVFPCKICGIIYHNQRELTQHTMSRHNYSKRCLACNEHFPDDDALIGHQVDKSHTFKCPLCGESFQTQIGLQRHHIQTLNSCHRIR